MSEELKKKYYKLVKPEYEEAVRKITGFDFDFVNNISGNFPYYPVVSGKYPTTAYHKLEKAGVINLWFEEVNLWTEPKFKKGDWIEMDSSNNTGKFVALVQDVIRTEVNYRFHNEYYLKFPFREKKDGGRYEETVLKENPRKLLKREVELYFRDELKRMGYFDKSYIQLEFAEESGFYIGEGAHPAAFMDVRLEETLINGFSIAVYWKHEKSKLDLSYRVWSEAKGWSKITRKYEEPTPKKEFKYKEGDFVICSRELLVIDQKNFIGIIIGDGKISQESEEIYYEIMPVNYKVFGGEFWNYDTVVRKQSAISRKAEYMEILEAFDQEAKDRKLYPSRKDGGIAKFYPHPRPTYEASRVHPLTGAREQHVLWKKKTGWLRENPFQEFPKLNEILKACSDCDIDDHSVKYKKPSDDVMQAIEILIKWLDEN